MNNIDKLIFDTATGDGMPEPLAKMIVGQSRLETGNYQHHFFTNGNNAFGYSYDKNSRWQIAPGGLADNRVKIAQYKSVSDSVHELTDWIKRRQKDGQFPKDLSIITTPEKYAYHLRNGSHPYGGLSDKQYSQGIRARLKQILLDVTGGSASSLSVLLFIGIIAILLITNKN